MSGRYRRRAVEVLRAARRLLADPARWCRGALATDAEGQTVEPCSLVARRWCAAGAVERAGFLMLITDRLPEAVLDQAMVLLLDTVNQLGFEEGGVGDFNDSHGHREVLALLDKAILAAEAGERQAELVTERSS